MTTPSSLRREENGPSAAVERGTPESPADYIKAISDHADEMGIEWIIGHIESVKSDYDKDLLSSGLAAGGVDVNYVIKLVEAYRRLERERDEAREAMPAWRVGGSSDMPDDGTRILAIVCGSHVVTWYVPEWGTWYGEETDYATEDIQWWMPIIPQPPARASKESP